MGGFAYILLTVVALSLLVFVFNFFKKEGGRALTNREKYLALFVLVAVIVLSIYALFGGGPKW